MAVQYNDPDPVLWVAIYGAACVISVVAGLRRRVPRAISGVVAVVALTWGMALALDVPGLGTFTHMFDAWEMRSQAIEQAREASGLFIVVAWMFMLFLRPDVSGRNRA
jgi:hypothetical protein